MDEQWRVIPGYDGDYEVSDQGRVRSHKHGTWKILKPARNSSGYLFVGLCTNGKRKQLGTHHLVLEAFIGHCPEGHEANHKDGNKRNNNVENLEWITHTDNMDHAARMGLCPVGERNGQSKHTTKQVIEIRQLHAEGNVTQREIAKMFGIPYPTVWQIVHRKTWRHIK